MPLRTLTCIQKDGEAASVVCHVTAALHALPLPRQALVSPWCLHLLLTRIWKVGDAAGVVWCVPAALHALPLRA